MLNTDVENTLTKTIHVKLVAFRRGCWDYVTYIFQNLDDKDGEYISCTRFPNWTCAELKVGDVGFLKYREVIAGDSRWYDWKTNRYIPYKYSGIHFLDFIYEKPKEDIVM